jgi:hypothetical protein
MSATASPTNSIDRAPCERVNTFASQPANTETRPARSTPDSVFRPDDPRPFDGRKTQTRRIIKPQPHRIGHDADDGSDIFQWKRWIWNGTIDALSLRHGGQGMPRALKSVCATAPQSKTWVAGQPPQGTFRSYGAN